MRINLYTILLAYTMNSDYITYYFAPLVTMWFLIIYATLAIGSRLNERTPLLLAKILFSSGLVTWFMHEPRLLEGLFDILARTCGIHWSAREWAFRVKLDLHIVYYGMLFAVGFLKIREHRLTDSKHWPTVVRIATVVSVIVMFWYFGFELTQESKFTYNTWHPYVSFLPITAFIVMRNANGVLRSAHSRAFAFIGKCSLETFIIQYHLWLAADTKGLLMVIPGTRWRPANFVITSIIFIYVSHRVSEATGVITSWICGTPKKTGLPTNTSPTLAAASASASTQPLMETDVEESAIPLETKECESLHAQDELDALPEPERWVDRMSVRSASILPAGPYIGKWNPGVKTKLGIAVALMWITNVLWPYPYRDLFT